MPIVPQPDAPPTTSAVPTPDKWADASFYDVTLVRMTEGLLASAAYAPGPLIVQLALAATAEMMYETNRWARPPGAVGPLLTPEEAEAVFRDTHPNHRR